MEIKNLITFRSIINEGGFGKAASKLGYTQSTITFQVRQLEEELGVTLFEKIGRKMVLTQEGKEMIPFVDETLLSYEKMINAGKDIFDLCGELNIIMAETLLCYRTQNVIAKFRQMAPNVNIKLRTMSCYATRQALIEGSADIGVFYDQEDEDERLTIHSLGHVPMSLIGAQQMSGTDFCKSNQKLQTSFVTDEPDCIFRLLFERYSKDNSIFLGNTIELWSIATIKQMVISNLGISYLPTFTVEDELKKKQLIEIPNSIPAEKLRAVYGYHRNKCISRQMELFIQLIEENMKF